MSEKEVKIVGDNKGGPEWPSADVMCISRKFNGAVKIDILRDVDNFGKLIPTTRLVKHAITSHANRRINIFDMRELASRISSAEEIKLKLSVLAENPEKDLSDLVEQLEELFCCAVAGYMAEARARTAPQAGTQSAEPPATVPVAPAFDKAETPTPEPPTQEVSASEPEKVSQEVAEISSETQKKLAELEGDLDDDE